MSTERKRRWGRIVGIFVVLVVAGGVWFSQLGVPHPWMDSPEVSAQRIMEVPEARRWQVAMAYGKVSALFIDLPEARIRADALPPGLDRAFYDGMAHLHRFDGQDTTTVVQEIQDNIPQIHHSVFYDGLMRSFTRDHAESPGEVMAFAAELTEITGQADLSNGIRIGLQQELGGDMSEAISVAARYPETLHLPLFEELGWRLGHEVRLDSDQWLAHRDQIPQPAQCSFAEGMVRGAVINALGEQSDWGTMLSAFRASVSEDCEAAVLSGLAEALLIVLGFDEALLYAEVGELKDTAAQEKLRIIIEDKRRAARALASPPPGALPQVEDVPVDASEAAAE